MTIKRPYALGRHELSLAEFTAFVASTGHRTDSGCSTNVGNEFKMDPSCDWLMPGYDQTDQHPVVCVSWEDAERYAVWLAQVTGNHYRLPSEAEWEYAAMAGSATVRSWGDDPDEACFYGNVSDMALKERFGATGIHNCRDGHAYPAPVGSFRANSFGLHDMLGNVWEWAKDCYHRSYTEAPVDGRPWISAGECDVRMLRGGSLGNRPPDVRSAYRLRISIDLRDIRLGFRVARDLD